MSEAAKAATPFVIGILGFYIAWRQWSTAHHKLRLDLFDRRMSVYEPVAKFIAALNEHRKIDVVAAQTVIEKIAGGQFYFDKRQMDLLRKILVEVVAVQAIQLDLNQLQTQVDQPQWKEELKSRIKSVQALQYEMPATFEPLLTFGKVT